MDRNYIIDFMRPDKERIALAVLLTLLITIHPGWIKPFNMLVGYSVLLIISYLMSCAILFSFMNKRYLLMGIIVLITAFVVLFLPHTIYSILFPTHRPPILIGPFLNMS